MDRESEVPSKSEADELNQVSILGHPKTRRTFIKQVAGTSAAIAIGPNLLSSASQDEAKATRSQRSKDSRMATSCIPCKPRSSNRTDFNAATARPGKFALQWRAYKKGTRTATTKFANG